MTKIVRRISPVLLFSILILWSCNHNRPYELYHIFPGNQWPRFNKISFEIPVEKNNQTVDIVLFARFTSDFQYETLDFNMVLQAAGEERIHEYQMKVKPDDGAKTMSKNGVFEASCVLKKQFNTGKPGIMIIEIESLTPRLTTEGIAGLGVRIVPVR